MSQPDTDPRDERIRAFILGQMTEADETAFLADLQRDAELRQRASLIARMMQAMAEVGTEHDRQLIDAFLSVDADSVRAIVTAQRRQGGRISPNDAVLPAIRQRRWRRAALVAAVVLLVVTGGWYLGYHHTVSLGHRYARTFETSGVVHGTADSLTVAIEALYAQVRDGRELPTVTAQLRARYEASLLDEENAYTDHSFLLGWHLAIAYLEQGQRRAALAQLRRMQAQDFPKAICRQKVDELLLEISAWPW